MSDILSKFPIWTEQQHIQSKGMYAGTYDHMELDEFVFEDTIRVKKMTYSPALLQMFMEIALNALDQATEMFLDNAAKEDRVTKIDISFDKTTGKIRIANNGRGIPTLYHPEAKMHVPQYVFTKTRASSKLEKKAGKIVLGTNGYGVKIVLFTSAELSLTTIYKYADRSEKYTQTWRDRAEICEPPAIKNTKEKQMTCVEFLPDYSRQFNYAAAIPTEMDALFKFRTYMMAAYIAWMTRGECKITYNGEICAAKSIRDVAAIYSKITFAAELKPTGRLPMEIVVAVPPEIHLPPMTTINGTFASRGPHIATFEKQLVAGIKDIIAKKLGNVTFRKAYVLDNITLLINAAIPEVDWPNQKKDDPAIPAKALADYKLEPDFIAKIAAALETKILESIYDKAPVVDAPKINRTAELRLDKYEAATFAKPSHKRKSETMLFLPEGDSAATPLKRGIRAKDPKTKLPYLGPDLAGIFTLRGVLINVRKEIEEMMILGKKTRKLSETLKENDIFNDFMKVTGLDLNCTYEDEKQMKKLSYGHIVGFVDEDTDGAFIFGLIVNMFEVFWPNLLARGYLQRFVTPIKRAYPKRGGKIAEFRSEYEYQRWAKTANVADYNIRYYKGIGANDAREIEHLFSDYRRHIYTYYVDDKSAETYELFFGKNTNVRKSLFRQDFAEPPEELISCENELRRISITSHAKNQLEIHKRENIHRMAPDFRDGRKPVQRKILYGTMDYFAKSNKNVKVDILTSALSKATHYHHGPTSMQNTIFLEATTFIGGNQLPMLLPRGECGSRGKGGDDHSSSRYAEVCANKKLIAAIFPAADEDILPLTNEEGTPVEPEFYVPILPMAILRHIENPMDGWKVKIFARDVSHVIEVLKYMIRNYKKDVYIPPLKPDLRGFRGDTRFIGGKWSLVGKYVFAESTRTVHISELPIRVWHEYYIDRLRKERQYWRPNDKTEVKMFKWDIRNNSDDKYGIDIQIELEEPNGGHDPLAIIKTFGNSELDCFEDYFRLKKSFKNHLNLTCGYKVLEYETYEDIMRDWFESRKNLYELRIHRQLILLELEIAELESLIRYVANYETLAIKGAEKEAAYAKLAAENYIRIDSKVKISETPTAELKPKIINSAAATYDYLLNTRDSDKLRPAILRREAKLAELYAAKEKLAAESRQGAFIGAKIWLDEVEKAAAIIGEGLACGWNTDAEKFTF